MCFNSNHPNIDFQDGGYGGHFGFRHDFSYFFIYTSDVTCCYIVSFNLIRLVVCEKMSKTDFQYGGLGGHLEFLNRHDFSSFRSISCPVATEQVSAQIDQRFGKRCQKSIFKMAAVDFRSAQF